MCMLEYCLGSADGPQYCHEQWSLYTSISTKFHHWLDFGATVVVMWFTGPQWPWARLHETQCMMTDIISGGKCQHLYESKLSFYFDLYTVNSDLHSLKRYYLVLEHERLFQCRLSISIMFHIKWHKMSALTLLCQLMAIMAMTFRGSFKLYHLMPPKTLYFWPADLNENFQCRWQILCIAHRKTNF